MARRKSNKQVKAMLIDTVKDDWFMVATDAYWSGKSGVCVEYIDGGYGEFNIGGTISIKANQEEV